MDIGKKVIHGRRFTREEAEIGGKEYIQAFSTIRRTSHVVTEDDVVGSLDSCEMEIHDPCPSDPQGERRIARKHTRSIDRIYS